jgi:hypothetical protein
MPTENEKLKCKQKTRYKNDHEAQQSIKILRDKHGVRKSLRTYKCSVCLGYHITSSPKR